MASKICIDKTTFHFHYFTFTRRKNEAGEPSGVIVALALPSAVRPRLTVSPSEENADSFNSAAPSMPNASASRAPSPISAPPRHSRSFAFAYRISTVTLKKLKLLSSPSENSVQSLS